MYISRDPKDLNQEGLKHMNVYYWFFSDPEEMKRSVADPPLILWSWTKGGSHTHTLTEMGPLPGFLLSPGSSCSGPALARPSSFSCPPAFHPAVLSPPALQAAGNY